jgi:rhodanese-related sulfurtransferase
MQRISPRDAKQKMESDGYVYVDVRSVEEFDRGHPEGAFNVPLIEGGQPNAAFLEVMQSAFDRGEKIILGCAAGGRSLRAAQMLEAAGFTNVVDQRAGFEGARNAFGQVQEKGWAAEGLPSSTDAAGRGWNDLRSKKRGTP